MEIVYLVSRAKIAGPINQALNILRGLNAVNGVHAVLMTLNEEIPNNSWLHRFPEAGIDVVQLKAPKFSMRKSRKLLNQYVEEHHVDIVHSSGYRADIINIAAHRTHKTVSTQRCHPFVIRDQTRWPFRSLVYGTRMKVIKQMDVIVACAKSLQKEFKSDLGMEIEAVQNGVNTDYFTPVSATEKSRLRQELGLPDDKRIYLVLGNVVARKNVKIIIEAFKRWQQPDCLLLIVGGGDLVDEMKNLASGNENIVFKPKTNVPVKYLQASDLLISSALSEGLPNTVLEGLACGLPCVLSDIGPHEELIEGTEAGALFTSDSAESLLQTLQESYNWDLGHKSIAARQLAEDHFSTRCLASNYLKIYNNILLRK